MRLPEPSQAATTSGATLNASAYKERLYAEAKVAVDEGDSEQVSEDSSRLASMAGTKDETSSLASSAERELADSSGSASALSGSSRVPRTSKRGYRRTRTGARSSSRGEVASPRSFRRNSSRPPSSDGVQRPTQATLRTATLVDLPLAGELSATERHAVSSVPPTLRQTVLSEEGVASTDYAEDQGDEEMTSGEEAPALLDVVDPLVGLVIDDRYRIVECIGRGGMGIVYRVEHTSIGKLLAMKLLAGELSASDEVVRRFRQEALTVSKLSSPHTVQVFDYGRWQHLTYLVMELVHGKELSRLLRDRGPVPFSLFGTWLVQVCASLSEAHKKGITHRDVKPENIMIVRSADGSTRAKVLDFGLAKLREGQELNDVTQQGAVVGTPYYMAPEQVLGEEVDGRTDIYSLGAVMYRVLTGYFPFAARTPMAMFTKHLTEQARSIDERFPELKIPTAICRAVDRCLAKVPADRFQHIEDLSQVVQAELQKESGEAEQGESGVKSLSRSRAKVAALEVSQVVTREELEAYETRLRRNRYGAHILLASTLVAVFALVAIATVRNSEQDLGREQEPNNVASEASVLKLDTEVRGKIGARLDGGSGDRDFYRFELKSDQVVGLQLKSLPNFPICLVLYRVGYSDNVARYCTGIAGQNLEVGSVRLAAGGYFLAVMQDYVAGKHKSDALVYENVSDDYSLYVASPSREEGAEVEPNDTALSAQFLAKGRQLRGTLAWQGDVDYICAKPGSGPVRWHVEDQQRPVGTVLEVTPIEAGQEQPLLRIHAAKARPYDRARLEADVNTPWQGPTSTSGKSCLRLRLVRDPWQDEKETWPTPNPYVVTLQEIR
jgi:eukaryotic-like serine/threonine-protein kinase